LGPVFQGFLRYAVHRPAHQAESRLCSS
jgi:hypothetical protein